MKVKENVKYSLACPTSMGLRITPTDRRPVHNSDMFMLQATSAESNVLNIASSLGLQGLVLTKFVEGSPLSEYIKADLRRRNIAYVGKSIPQGGPWGYRHQINIADSGFGLRAPRVWNDRAGEVGCTLSIEDFDVDRIFKDDGVGILHLSGLIAAISPGTTRLCVELAKVAKENRTLISFDLNYRETFWVNRKEELSKAFRDIAEHTDILIGNEEDFQLCLGFEGPETGGKDIKSKINGFKYMIESVRKEFPMASLYATTLREVISANEHLWGAIVCEGNEFFIEEPRPIQVEDRIGGGDGFSGGLLYGVLKEYAPEKCLQLGWASGVLAASSLKDYAEPADEKQLWDIYGGNARVQR